MIEVQAIWIGVHVLLLVYWLGADISVFYSSLQIIKPEISRETRAAIAKILGFINWVPLLVSIPMLPVGLMLAAGRGLSPVEGAWLVIPWVLSCVWLLVAIGAATQRGTSLGKVYATIDLWIRCALILALVFCSVLSFESGLPFKSNWLALKILLYAFVLVCGLGIRFTFASFGPAFGRLMVEGSSAEVEAAIKKPVMQVKPWVLGLWAGLVAMAFLGIAQPGI